MLTGRRPTLEDIASRAGVSRATASRVVNEDPRVREESREAVAAAIKELGYRPNRAARSLVVREADSVAVVVPEPDERVFADPMIMQMLRGISDALNETSLQMVLLMGRTGSDGDRLARYLRGGHTDGAVVLSSHRDDHVANVLQEIHLPTVLLGRHPGADLGLPGVDADNVAGARLATRHLLAQGCRRIATVSGPLDMAAGIDRLTGWRLELEAAGLAGDAALSGDFSMDGGAAAMRSLLSRFPDVDGVFAASDAMASGALAELARAGRCVPDDVKIVGFDNSPLARLTTPVLTTVTNPAREMAVRGTEMLVRMMAGGPGSREILPVELVLGDTA